MNEMIELSFWGVVIVFLGLFTLWSVLFLSSRRKGRQKGSQSLRDQDYRDGWDIE